MGETDINRSERSKEVFSDKNSITILDIAYVLVKHRLQIILTTLISVALSLFFLILSVRLPPEHNWNYFPDQYISTIKVLLTWESTSEIQKQLGISQFSSLSASLAPVFGNPYLELTTQLIMGNTLLDYVAEKLDLYIQLKRNREGARGWLRERISISALTTMPVPTFSILQIGFTDTDNVMAYNILKELKEQLSDRFNKITSSQLQDRKTFILERIEEVKRRMVYYERELKGFRDKYGFIDIDQQGKYQTNLIAEKTTEILRKRLEIRLIRQYSNEDDPRIRKLEDEIKTIEQFINEMKTKQMADFMPLQTIPELSAKYIDVKQNYDIQYEIYSRLKEEQERINIDETNSLNNFKVIDEAELAPYPFAPRREVLFLLLVLGALFLTIVWVFVKEYFIRLIGRPIEAKKYDEIRAAFGKNKQG